MMKKGKRKRPCPHVTSVMSKVFERYGYQESSDENRKSGEIFVKGRKQKRREMKIQRQQVKQKHFEKLSKRVKLDDKVKDKERDVNVEQSVMEQSTKRQTVKESRKITIQEKRNKKFKKENIQEDKIINTLEKKLFLHKRKNKSKLPKSFCDSGLDYVLNALDGGGGSSDEESAASAQGDFFLDDKVHSKKEEIINKNHADVPSDEEEVADENLIVSDEEQEDSDGSEHLEEEDQDIQEECEESVNVSEEFRGDGEDSDERAESKDNADLLPAINSGKYIPPALRKMMMTDSDEKMRQLTKKIKGLYNKLSDANLNSICNEIEMIYLENSRAVTNQMISDMILEQFTESDPVPENLVMETAMLITVLSKRIAVEVLAHFYEAISVKLHSILTKPELQYSRNEGKATNNLVQLLGCLYQLKSTDSKVLQDIFHLLISSFAEKDIELMLDILNKVGFLLRKDDPQSLQDIMKEISVKSKECKCDNDDGSRMSFMLNILMAVKNNNVRKVTGYDPDLITARRKRVVSLLQTKKGIANSESFPSVALKDFLNAEINGRWWIVGSSWSGRPMLKNQEDVRDEMKDIENSISKSVIKAAKSQRMNTDVRKKIFYAVMTADDYIEAFEKVTKLGLKGKQLREIAYVIVNCCQQGKSFNQYFVYLLNRFCQSDRQFIISLQCAMWDRFKLVGSLKKVQLDNIAQLLSNLIVKEAVPVSCLKAIDFAEMDKPLVDFLRSLLCLIVENCGSIDQLKTVFSPLCSSTKFAFVRQGLQLFLGHFMLADKSFIAAHASTEESLSAIVSVLSRSSFAVL